MLFYINQMKPTDITTVPAMKKGKGSSPKNQIAALVVLIMVGHEYSGSIFNAHITYCRNS